MENSVRTSKTTNNTQIFDEKTGLDKFFSDIKDSVFQVLYLVLKDEDNTFIGVAMNTSLDYLQMLSFTFNNMISSVWEAQSFLTFIFNFFAFFDLTSYFSGAITWTYYLIAFYGCILAIMAIIANIIYVSISFSRKRVSIIWPVVLLRSVTSLFVTVLFLPITQVLLSMIQCEYDPDSGKFVHTIFPDVECWKGTHIIHGALTILMSIIFIIVCMVVALTYFECRMLTEDPTARQHSHGDMVFLINKIVLQITFSFFPLIFADDNTMQWAITTTIFAGGFILYYYYNFTEPFYRKEVSLLFKILTTYYLWTCGLLLISKILSPYGFDGGLIAWIIGIPFIGVIMITSPKSRVENLLSSTSKFKTSQQLQDHVRFLLQIIDYQKIDNNAYMLLVGYIEKHKDSCIEDDCPLRMKSYTRRKAIINDEKNQYEMDEINKRLLIVIDRMYTLGIKKFKSDPGLKVSYAFFLIERIKSKKKALLQIELANELDPNFETQFIIYRLKRLITDGVNEESDTSESGGLDLVGMIAYENFLTLCEDYMKQSAALHKDFWMELREEKPDLKKLNIYGKKVNSAIVYTKEYYIKLQKLNGNIPQVLRIYGRFLIDIQNEYEEGMSLIMKYILNQKIFIILGKKRAKELEKKKEKLEISKKIYNDIDLEVNKEPLPYVIVNADLENLGKIKKSNMLFIVMTGMGKDEILNRKINYFIPDVIAQYHDSFIKHYLTKEEESISLFLNIDNDLYIKNKSGFIIPVTVRVKLFEDQNSIPFFMGTFKPQTHKKTYVHIITRKDGSIIDFSASALSTLNFQVNQMKKTRVNIDELVPNCLRDPGFREGKSYLHKVKDENNAQIDSFQMNALVSPLLLREKSNNEALNLIAQENRLDTLSANTKDGKENSHRISKFEFPAIQISSQAGKRGSKFDCYTEDSKNDLIYGYLIRLEKIENIEIPPSSKLKPHIGSSILPSSNKRKYRLNKQESIKSKNEYRSLYDKSLAKSTSYNSSHVETTSTPGSKKNIKDQEPDNDPLIAGFITDNTDLELNDLFSQKIKIGMEGLNAEKIQEERHYIDYGEGIHTKFLRNGEIKELKHLDEEDEAVQNGNNDEEDDEEEEDRLFKIGDNNANNDHKKNKKKKEKLSIVKKLVRESLESTKDNLSIIRLKNISYLWIVSILIIAILQQIYAKELLDKYYTYPKILTYTNSRIYEMTSIMACLVDLVTMNKYNTINTVYSGANETYSKELIKTEVLDIININGELTTSELYPIIKAFEEQYIPLDFIFNNQTITQNYMQAQGVSTILGLAYNVSNFDLENFDFENDEIQMVIQNINNLLLPYLLVSNQQILNEFISTFINLEAKFLILIAVLILFSIVSATIITVLLFDIESQKEDILLLFIEIPLSNVEEISKRRDSFMEYYESQKEIDKKKDDSSVDSLETDRNEEGFDGNNGDKKRGQIFDSSLKKGHSTVEENDDYDEARKARKKMLKKYRKKKFSRSKHLLATSSQLFFFSLLYALTNYIILMVLMKKLQKYVPQFNSLGLLAGNFQDSMNSNRIMALNTTMLLENKLPTMTAYSDILRLNDGGRDLEEFYQYSYDQDNQFSSQFIEVLFGDACQYLPTDSQITSCRNSLNQSLSMGIISAKEQIFKVLRNNYVAFISRTSNIQNIISYYQTKILNWKIFQFAARKSQTFFCTKSYRKIFFYYKNMSNLILGDDFRNYFTPVLQYFLDYEQAFLDNNINSSLQALTIIVVLFFVFILIRCVTYWFPHIAKLNAEIWRTKGMINMIPLEVVNKTPAIKEYLKELIKKKQPNYRQKLQICDMKCQNLEKEREVRRKQFFLNEKLGDVNFFTKNFVFFLIVNIYFATVV